MPPTLNQVFKTKKVKFDNWSSSESVLEMLWKNDFLKSVGTIQSTIPYSWSF